MTESDLGAGQERAVVYAIYNRRVHKGLQELRVVDG